MIRPPNLLRDVPVGRGREAEVLVLLARDEVQGWWHWQRLQPGQAFGFANRGQAMTHRILCPNGVTGAVASGSLLVRNYPILSRGVPCTARSSEIARYR
jgi:hypothetical protein